MFISAALLNPLYPFFLIPPVLSNAAALHCMRVVISLVNHIFSPPFYTFIPSLRLTGSLRGKQDYIKSKIIEFEAIALLNALLAEVQRIANVTLRST